VWFDASSGRFLEFRPPYGRTAADGFDKITRLLHVAALFGLPYRVLVSVFGLATAATALTGCLMWVRRRALGAKRTVQPLARAA
jgi:uncharacterized iron-regulated membrane protein